MSGKKEKSSTKMKTEFLTLAIEEVQQTNRFLDTKAGVLVAFESSLLVVLVTFLIDTSKLQLVQTYLSQIPIELLVLLIAYAVAYSIALIVQILITLKVIFPKESPEHHIDVGDYQPRGLFFLHRLDSERRIIPAITEYSARLGQMDEEDIIDEYVFELEKLSYIRKVKSDGLTLSFRVLAGLIIGIAVLGLLIVLGAFV